MTRAEEIGDARFHTPGWGENRRNGAVGVMQTKAAKALVEAIGSGGQRTAM